jgi:hypothetical protein
MMETGKIVCRAGPIARKKPGIKKAYWENDQCDEGIASLTPPTGRGKKTKPSPLEERIEIEGYEKHKTHPRIRQHKLSRLAVAGRTGKPITGCGRTGLKTLTRQIAKPFRRTFWMPVCMLSHVANFKTVAASCGRPGACSIIYCQRYQRLAREGVGTSCTLQRTGKVYNIVY